MKLSEIKAALPTLERVNFKLPSGGTVPVHFHVTEIGMIEKNFIDCGGVIRKEKVVNFQLWEAGDFDHRIAPQKLIQIIELSEKQLGIEDLEIEVEYQQETIGKFGLEFDGFDFLLTNKQTDCLAKEECGIPSTKQKVSLSELGNSEQSCAPGSGCC